MTDQDNSDKESSSPSPNIAASNQPSNIGAYKILDTLGEGGMSVVYLAEQTDPVKRRVALKMLKPGMDSKEILARFQSERQALAVLDHPNIAKIFDGGIADSGLPYFVMEHVKGVPVTDYCDNHRLTNEERIKLFIDVCSAVQHAHLKGLIHRDLKPSNIMVGVVDGKPTPKVIDFGIAKATAKTLTEETLYTRIGQIVGTPQYMSPEQADLTGVDIDTRTDIYSLGVVLYELLVGTVPLDLRAIGDYAMQQALREKDPPKPSTRLTELGDTQSEIAKVRRTEPGDLRRQLRGDLDWITMRAIEKDRTRRYETVNALAMECKRFLNHEPVLARPPTAGYSFSRFVRRNRVMVVAGLVATVAVVAGTAAATLGYLRATNAEQIALQEAETARQVSGFLIDLFEVSDPSEARGNSITAREILNRGAERIEGELRGQPGVQATMLDTVANVYYSLGLYEESEELLLKAQSIAAEIYTSEDPRLTKIEQSMGELYFAVSRYDESEELLLSALEKDKATFGQVHARIANLLGLLSTLYNKMDKLDEAEKFANENLAVRLELYGVKSLEYATGLNNMARVEREKGRFDVALAHSKESLRIMEDSLPANHPTISTVLGEISNNLSEQGLLEEQEPYVLRALAIDEEVYGPAHDYFASSLESVGIFYAQQGKLEQAEPYFLRALETTEAAVGTMHDSVGFRYYNLGFLYGDMQEYEKAEPYLRRSIEIWTEVFDEIHGSNAYSWNALAQNYRELGRIDEARDAATIAFSINEQVYGSEHQNTAATMLTLAVIARDEARYDVAKPLYAQALVIYEKQFGLAGTRTMEVLREYEKFLELAGMESEAAAVRDRLGNFGE